MDYNQLNWEWLAYEATYEDMLNASAYVCSDCDAISIHEAITDHLAFYRKFVA